MSQLQSAQAGYETPCDWHFLCFFPAPPTSQFLLFIFCSQSEFIIFTFCSPTVIPPVVLPVFYIYMDLMHVALLQCYHSLSLSEFFILIYSLVGWISLSSNSLKKGSWVLYSFCFFILSLPFFLLEQQRSWL